MQRLRAKQQKQKHWNGAARTIACIVEKRIASSLRGSKSVDRSDALMPRVVIARQRSVAASFMAAKP